MAQVDSKALTNSAVEKLSEYKGLAQKGADIVSDKMQGYKEMAQKGATNIKDTIQTELQKPAVRGPIWNIGSIMLLSLLGVSLAAIGTVLLFGTLAVATFWSWLGTIGLSFALGGGLLLWSGLTVASVLALPLIVGFCFFSSIPISFTMLSWATVKSVVHGLYSGVKKQQQRAGY